MEIGQHEVYLIALDPALGHEIKKTRPCVVVSPDEMNINIQTVIIVPMTTKSHDYPTRVGVTFQGKKGWVVLDQIRSVDRRRLVKRLGSLNEATAKKVRAVIREMLAE